jgi:hypothetical protein
MRAPTCCSGCSARPHLDRIAVAASLRVLRYAVIAAALWYLCVYLTVALLRISYPFDLEWMEGGSVDHVVRVLAGQTLYIQPQIAFIPFDYPPLYFYVCALVARIVGVGYFPLRLVSVASSLVCFGCIYQIVKKDTNSRFSGIIAAGLFAATFRISGAWLDLARVDSMCLALFLLAILILHSSRSVLAYVVTGILLALSFLTKQPALAMALPVVLYAVYVHRRRGLWLAVSLSAIVAISSVLFHVATSGWYTFYVWEFPFKHPFLRPSAVTFWTQDMLARLPIAFTASLLLVVWCLLGRQRAEMFWPAVFVGMTGAAYRSRLQSGAFDNVLMPAYAITAILFGLIVGRAIQSMGQRSATRNSLAEAAVYTACIIQMALLGYNPRALVPRMADRAAREQLLEAISAVSGDVFVPSHGYVTTAAGKSPHAHLMALFDIAKVGDEQSAKLAEQLRTAIRQTAFDAIVLDDRTTYFFMREIEASYVLQSRVFSDPNVLYPLTGGVVGRPDYFYVPKVRRVPSLSQEGTPTTLLGN